MLRRSFFALLLTLGLATLAHAQNVTVTGPVTAGDCVAFNSNTVLRDSGFACPTNGVWTNTVFVNFNSSILPYPNANLFFQGGAANNNDGYLVFDTWGIGAQGHNADTHFLCRVARGTRASPSAVGTVLDFSPAVISSGDSMCLWGAVPYGTTGYASTPTGFVVVQPAELQTDTAQGSRVRVGVTRNGTVTSTGGAYNWTFNNDGQLEINQNTVAPPTFGLNSTSKLRIIGANNASIFASVEGYGATGFPGLNLSHALGTAALPTAVTNTTILGGYGLNGYGSAGFSTSSGAQFRAVASENWGPGAEGTLAQIMTTPNGTTAITTAVQVEASGGVSIPPAVTGGDKGAGAINATSIFQANVPVVTTARSISTTAPIAGGGDLSANRTFSINANGVTNALSAQMATNTVKGNFTSGTANAADNAMPSCSAATTSAVIYTTNTGFGCRTDFTTNATAAVGQLPGTATNDNAASGKVGEYIEVNLASGSSVSFTNNTATDVITTLSLTAGDWDVEGNCATQPAATTTMALVICWVHNVANTLPGVVTGYSQFYTNAGATANQSYVVPTGARRFSISSTTTIRLEAYVTFAVSTLGVYGNIRARRAR